MNEEIATFKQDFQDWLDKKLATTTPKNRRSTSYDYMRRIERICDKFFQGHDNACFLFLKNNIVPILSLYTEYENTDHYFYNQKSTLGKNSNENPLVLYFEALNNNLKGCWNILSTEFFDMSIIIHEKEYFISKGLFLNVLSYIRAFECVTQYYEYDVERIRALLKVSTSVNIDAALIDFIKKLKQILTNANISSKMECIFHIKYNVDKENQKNKIALKRFCDYLYTNDIKIKPIFNFPLTSIEKQSLKEGQIEEIESLTGNSPKQIFVDNRRLLNQNEVAEILDCHSNSLKKLAEGNLIKAEDSYEKAKYSVNNINAYLREHHHQAVPLYNEVDYSKSGKDFWCTRGEAAKILGCSEPTVLDYARKHKLTYTDNIPKLSKYYIPELEYLKEFLRLDLRYIGLRKVKKRKSNHKKIAKNG